MWRWHDERYPRDNPERESAENDSAGRMAGSFLNPQNFGITIGKPAGLHTLVASLSFMPVHVLLEVHFLDRTQANIEGIP